VIVGLKQTAVLPAAEEDSPTPHSNTMPEVEVVVEAMAEEAAE
jgi:hypothetical protein